MCWQWLLAVVLVCIGTLVKTEEADPIYVAVGICLGCSLGPCLKTNQTGVIYQYQCPHIHCSSSYIGESGRSLGERVKEHLKAPSPIHLRSPTTGHPLDPNQFNIMHKEVHSQSRTIKEAMFICIQDPPSTAT